MSPSTGEVIHGCPKDSQRQFVKNLLHLAREVRVSKAKKVVKNLGNLSHWFLISAIGLLGVNLILPLF